MASETELYLNRAQDEFLLAKKDMELSMDDSIKQRLGIPADKTFFYSVISHAYYSIFYSAKAYLFLKGIKIYPPSEHKKTYIQFKEFVKKGFIDKELLKIYENELIKADDMLKILKTEKNKRGKFTYNIKSEANMPYAKESIENSRRFISFIKLIIESKK